MSFWSGPPPEPDPPETHFLELLTEVVGGGGVNNVKKRPPHFLG